jgi:hypothetical protein
MKLRSLTQSAGERAVKAILEDRLVKTPFQVWGKVRLNAAMGKEDGEHLPEELFAYLRSAELDYLIIRRASPHRPFLAVEFDGAHHEFEPKARHNDTLKNRLCRMSGLPILRVRSGEVEPLFRRDSFLSYVVDVILQYEVEEKSHAQSVIADIRRHDLADVRRLRYELAAKHHVLPAAGQIRFPGPSWPMTSAWGQWITSRATLTVSTTASSFFAEFSPEHRRMLGRCSR